MYNVCSVVFEEATTGRCGFHHSYITNADPEGAAIDCRLVGQADERAGGKNPKKM
jgi:hypothetical protein